MRHASPIDCLTHSTGAAGGVHWRFPDPRDDQTTEDRTLARLITATLMALMLLAGCSSTPEPTRFAGIIKAAQNINPDRSGRASPVVVWVFELASRAEFEAADYFALVDQDGSYLGEDLISRTEYQLDPGKAIPLKKELSSNTRVLGVVAAFRDIDNARWRSTIDLTQQKENQLQINIDQLAVSIQPGS